MAEESEITRLLLRGLLLIVQLWLVCQTAEFTKGYLIHIHTRTITIKNTFSDVVILVHLDTVTRAENPVKSPQKELDFTLTVLRYMAPIAGWFVKLWHYHRLTARAKI